MRSLPPVLVADIRHAFYTCSRQHAASRRARFSTYKPQLKGWEHKKNENLPIQVVHSRLQAQKKDNARPLEPSVAPSPEDRELVPRAEEATSLDHGRKIPVPLKVIPKADIAPGLTLSPKERLHIEQLTRKLPPRSEPKGSLGRLSIVQGRLTGYSLQEENSHIHGGQRADIHAYLPPLHQHHGPGFCHYHSSSSPLG
ncbi:hypothetical protein CLCR_00961 [Cladophialophora carrionii]|uniref:Uncharacterized protein n=1 Tax=Cladophialophora carrionii TaxID=86049 RepID=A0A1C1D122_9EURO|nr:hypothetical protein CLCR_00961 [Cladophialophora carrionii]